MRTGTGAVVFSAAEAYCFATVLASSRLGTSLTIPSAPPSGFFRAVMRKRRVLWAATRTCWIKCSHVIPHGQGAAPRLALLKFPAEALLGWHPRSSEVGHCRSACRVNEAVQRVAITWSTHGRLQCLSAKGQFSNHSKLFGSEGSSISTMAPLFADACG